jgi:ketosteroid isomerase-like protein
MSTASPKQVVKAFLDQLAGGGPETIVPMFTDDAVIDMPGTSDFPWAGRWEGRDKMMEYFKVMPAALEMHEHVINTWTEEGDRVAVTGTEAGSSRISGKHYRAKWCWVFTVRDGKIAFWDAYEDTQALDSCAPWR